MKSVGEAMAIGRTFPESLQKALRSLEQGGRVGDATRRATSRPTPSCRGDAIPTPERIFQVGDCLRRGVSRREVHEVTAIDPWFLTQMRGSSRSEGRAERSRARRLTGACCAGQALGFSDAQLAHLLGCDEDEVRAARSSRGHAGLQARRHVRGRVRGRDAVHLLDLRGRVRGRADRPPEGHDPGRRAEPHRAGHRVRLLLRARRVRARAKRASRPSWSTATRRRCRPTTTPPTACTSSR